MAYAGRSAGSTGSTGTDAVTVAMSTARGREVAPIVLGGGMVRRRAGVAEYRAEDVADRDREVRASSSNHISHTSNSPWNQSSSQTAARATYSVRSARPGGSAGTIGGFSGNTRGWLRPAPE